MMHCSHLLRPFGGYVSQTIYKPLGVRRISLLNLIRLAEAFIFTVRASSTALHCLIVSIQ